jgi:hypothetical protein
MLRSLSTDSLAGFRIAACDRGWVGSRRPAARLLPHTKKESLEVSPLSFRQSSLGWFRVRWSGIL